MGGFCLSSRMAPPVVWMMGGPGSGKGTQCEKINLRFGYCHLSSGDLLRAEIMSNSERGKQIFATMEKGILVPDELVISLLKEAMDKLPDAKGFIIDGFPAHLKQAELFEEKSGPPNKIIVFELNEEVMKIRLKARGNFDDQEEAIKKRVATYVEQTKPVIEKYGKTANLVNADQEVQAVFDEVCKILGS